MKNNVKKILGLVLLCGMVGSLAGCIGGGGKSSSPSQGTSENPSEQPSENPSQQPSENPSEDPSEEPSETSSEGEYKGEIKVVFGHTFGDKIESAVNRYIDKFVKLVKDNEGVDVKVELQYLGGYDDVGTKITTYYNDGTCPTMTIAYPDTVADFIRDFGTEHVVNFDNYMNDPQIGFCTDTYLGDTEDEDDIVQAFLDEGRSFVEEGTYVMPFMKSSEIMLYNLDIATEAMKIYNPSVVNDGKVEETIANYTWDELMDFAQCLYDNKATVCPSLKYPVMYDSDSNLFITQMFQNDYEYSGIKDGKGFIGFDDNGANFAGAVSLLNGYKELNTKKLFTTKGNEGKYSSNYFKNGETVFMIGSSGGAGYSFPEAGAFSTAICRVPYMNDKPYNISQGPSICALRNPYFSDAKNDAILKYAWKFIKYILSPNVNVALCVNGSEGYIPVRTSSYESEIYLEFMESGTNYADAARILTDVINGKYITSAVFPGSAVLRKQVGGAVTAAVSGSDTAESALRKAINETKIYMR